VTPPAIDHSASSGSDPGTAAAGFDPGASSAPGPRSIEEYEAVPYLLVLESVERDGAWLRRAEHPELPGCAAEATSILEAMDRLDQERRRILRALCEGGGPIPVPRPPLRSAARARSEPPAAAP
jgi:predicted RNase H-like HicB family nuclease